MIWFGQLALTLTPRNFAGISEKEGASLFLWGLKRGAPSSSPKGGLPFSFAFIVAFLTPVRAKQLDVVVLRPRHEARPVDRHDQS